MTLSRGSTEKMAKSLIYLVVVIVSVAEIRKAAGFLFGISQSGSSNSRMCSSQCDLSCPKGYVLSLMGCYLCSCSIPQGVPGIQTGTGGGMQLGLSSLQETFLPHPCIPSEHICSHTSCADGLQTGPGGCQYCACAIKHTDTPVTKETSTVPSDINKLPISTVPIISVNLTDINSHVTSTTTTQGVPTTKKVFKNPCILSMNTCDKDCGDHYVKGPEGCEYCLCQTMLNIPTTTAAVVNQTELPVDRDAMLKEACDIARTICQTRCPHGFHTKADDCFFCECANDSGQLGKGSGIQIGFSLTLPNPCVKGLHYCELLCLNGYWMGPGSCQYCACRV